MNAYFVLIAVVVVEVVYVSVCEVARGAQMSKPLRSLGAILSGRCGIIEGIGSLLEFI
jgi:hypothetical protein